MVDSVQTWQQAILSRFGPKRERILLVIDPDSLMRDDALLAEVQNRTYAMAPTLSSVPRQALLAGRPPTAFARTLRRTDKDAERWHAFGVNHDIPPKRVVHVSVSVNGKGLNEVRTIASQIMEDMVYLGC